MHFDARAAKAMAPGEHIIFKSYPGLRLSASDRHRSWQYRYKSPVDDRMRQVIIGRWPAMSFPAAIAAWEQLRDLRASGVDPALDKKQKRQHDSDVKALAAADAGRVVYTVRRLCDDFATGYSDHHRKRKGAIETRRMFDTMLGDFADVEASTVTRSMAFDLIQSYVGTAPVQASRLRCDLGAAWDYAIDAGRLPETAANWWRLILRGKIRSKGKSIGGERIGTGKRVLSDEEIGLLLVWLSVCRAVVRDVLTLYLWTCSRGAEIVQMMGSEITQEPGGYWWTIPKHKTKNARHANATDQRVPLVGRGLAVVLARKERFGNGFLFPKARSNAPIEQKYIQEYVYCHQPYSKIRPEEFKERCPVTHWSPHDLRRTARTVLAKLGCPDAVGEALLGHMMPGVLGTYNRHQYDDEKRVWVVRLAEHLESLVLQ